MLERSVAAASNDLDSDHNASNDEEQQRVHLGGWYTTSQPSSMLYSVQPMGAGRLCEDDAVGIIHRPAVETVEKVAMKDVLLRIRLPAGSIW